MGVGRPGLDSVTASLLVWALLYIRQHSIHTQIYLSFCQNSTKNHIPGGKSWTSVLTTNSLLITMFVSIGLEVMNGVPRKIWNVPPLSRNPTSYRGNRGIRPTLLRLLKYVTACLSGYGRIFPHQAGMEHEPLSCYYERQYKSLFNL